MHCDAWHCYAMHRNAYYPDQVPNTSGKRSTSPERVILATIDGELWAVCAWCRREPRYRVSADRMTIQMARDAVESHQVAHQPSEWW